MHQKFKPKFYTYAIAIALEVSMSSAFDPPIKWLSLQMTCLNLLTPYLAIVEYVFNYIVSIPIVGIPKWHMELHRQFKW